MPSEHISKQYDSELETLRSGVLQMGGLVESQIRNAIEAFSTGSQELVHELKKDYTIVMVTHNMQQAARVSDFTAYMYLGELIEYGGTDDLFIKPKKKQTEDYITGRFG